MPAQVFAAPGEIKGRVFEDINYSGGASRSFANAPGAKGINGAFVELYQKQGASFVKTAFTRTDSEGNYIFQGLSENDYRVRVLNNRNRPVSSARASSGKGGSGTILGTSIYRFDPDGGGTDVTREIGGRDPAAQTDAAETGAGAAFPAGSLIWTELTLGAGGADGVDFGFNFSTITNTNDTGPGSLRQFVENANGLVNTGLNVLGTTDTEVSVFEIPLTNGAAPRITLARGDQYKRRWYPSDRHNTKRGHIGNTCFCTNTCWHPKNCPSSFPGTVCSNNGPWVNYRSL